MKKPTILKNGLIVLLILFSIQLFAQNQVPFTPRFNQDLKGDIILIGNNILGPDNNDFNNGSTYNHTVDMRYIDIDSDATTFSSSSADLEIPINPNIPPAANDCYEIVHAGLYWSAVDNGSEAINTVKLRGPTGGYNDIVADDIIFDAGGTSVDSGESFPYACYADVTNIIRALGTDQGTYTVANVSSREGRTELDGNNTGNSAGWSLFIVYQNPSLPGKSVTSFDGFSVITRSTPGLDVPVSGFRTVPAPAPVRANFAFAALEGDEPITGDRLIINGTRLSDTNRGENNFFNSSVTGPPARQPNSSNTLGFDTGVLAVPNPSNGVIGNDDTSATVRLETGRDTYFPYFFAFAVDIIAPNMVLTKTVEDTSGNNVGGGLVNLGDELNYIIAFQNTGNDDATGLTIRDVLPNNIIFDYPADMGLLPPGVTVQSYDPVTRELIFAVDDSVVEENDPILEIRFKVTVVRECSLLNDACDNIVNNQAFSTYRGTLNPLFVISDDPSFSTNTGCLLIPGATNFITDINCTFEEDVILCGDNVVLTAGDNYDTYSWSTSPTGTPVIGTTQSITVTTPGTYYVRNTATAPCQSIDQIFNVITYGAGVTNPLIPFADQVVECPNDGKDLPNIFMCGATDTRFIDTNITDANSIIWERLDETSCPAVGNIDCANEDATCTWNQVQTGPDYLVDTAGQYRLTLNYTGGCVNRFYFNVYQNVLVPTAIPNDIICTTPGQIVVNDVPSGYEYSIDGTNYQASNTFSITTPGVYTVYVRQVGVTPNPCIFTVPNIQIRERDFTVTTDITQPLCHDGQGSVLVAANDVRPQYYYSIYNGATLINSVGPIIAGDYTFNNLNPGTYTINVSTDDGCTYSGDIDIVNPPELTATAALTTPLTCEDGEITVYPVGGTAPYFYFVNSTTVFQTLPQIPVTAAGTFNIRVVDSNNCFVDTSITVDAILPPEFNITKTDILCASSGNVGEININVTNPNGNTLRYSIDNGTTYVNSPVFTGLAAGDYEVIVEYTSGTTLPCFTASQTISIIELSPITGTATLTTPYTCASDGVITVSGVSGGTAPYTYSIDGVTFQSGTTFGPLINGTYTVTIMDANNCTFVAAPITLDPLDPPTDLTFTDKSFDCSDNTSSFNVNLPSWGGGLPPIRFQIIAVPAHITVGSPLYNYLTQINSDGQYSGVPEGVYTFQVTDRNGCTYQEDYILEPEPPIGVTGTLLNNVTCFNSSTGAFEFDVLGTFTGGNNVYDYDIVGPVNSSDTRQTAPTITLNNMPVGTYTITVTERSTGCTDTASVTVTGPPTGLAIATTVSPITCNVDGSVVINATGGWGGNTYTLTQPDTTVLGPQGSNTFANLTQAGTYTVTVTDTNGCTDTDTFTLSSPTAPSAVIDATSDLCYDVTNAATLVVTASGGQTPYEYNINGGSFGPSNTFANLTPGTYTIIVRDAYGCTVTLPAQTIAPQLTVSTVLTKDLDCTASPDALITGTIAGGLAPYTYEVSLNGGAYSPLGATGTPFTYLTATAGDYRFRITDSQGCQAESNVITINPISNPTATETLVNATCNGAADGSVQIVPSGGEGPYSYSFNGSAFTATSSYTGLSAGTYAYQVRDNKECIFDGSVTITEPAALAATASATPFSCSAANTSQPSTVTVTTTAGTGTAPYQYSFNGSGYSATNTFDVNDNGTDQTITYSVRDAQGCIFNGSVVITALNPPTVDSITGTPVTCNDVTSTVTLTAAAGTGVGTLTYEITAPVASATSNATGIFAGLAPGTYTFRITDADGCYDEGTYTVDPVINVVVTGALINDVSCNGGSDGAVDFTVSSFAGTYSYTINGGAAVTGQSATTINLTGLAAGDQVIVVTDETTGCTDTFTVTVTEPANGLTFSTTSTNVFCSNDESQITVSASGGTPNYTYAAVVTTTPAPGAGAYGSSNIVTVDTNSGADLVWDVYVRDANGCITMNTVTITNDALPTINPVAQQCYVGSTLNIVLSGTTHNGSATYSIGSGYQASPNFTINAPGTYTISIQDDNGCIASTTYVVEPQLTVSTVLTKDLDCTASPDALITGTIAGGLAPYTYEVSLNGGAYSPLGATGTPFTYLTATAGDYRFRITDSQGCQAESNVITINPISNPTATETLVNATCNGAADGSVQIVPSGGEGPYSYSFNGSAFTATSSYTGLSAGTYAYQVRDNKECIFDGSVTITEPAALAATASATPFSCSAANTSQPSTVTVTTTAGTGTAPYQYSFNGSGYSATNTFDVNDNGTDQTITYSVRDAQGCIFNGSVVITALNPPTVDSITGTPVTCNDVTSTVTLTAAAGTGVGTLTYEITAPVASATSNATGIFAGLAPGTYTFRITDADGCYDEGTYTVDPVINVVVTGALINDVSCNGGSDGAVDFTVSSFAGTYSYTINGGAAVTGQSATTINLTGLAAGDQVIVVTDETTGCTDTFTVTVTEPANGLTFSTTSTNVFCSNDESQITVSASGGTPNYTYAAVVTTTPAPGAGAYGASNIVTVDTNSGADLVWDVYVRDANGCITMNTVTIVGDPLPTVTTPAIPSNQCTVTSAFTFTVTGTGIAPLEYSINGGASYQTSSTFTVNTPGTYTVTVRDGNGCTATSATTTEVFAPLTAGVTLTKDITCSVPTDASMDITVSGGNGPFTYRVNTNGGGYSGGPIAFAGATFTYTTATAGTHQFEITDANGCTVETNVITTNAIVPVTVTEASVNPTCNGFSDGSITLTGLTGEAPFTYSLDGGATFVSSNVFGGLTAGDYDYVVRDSKGCDATGTITLNDPALIDVTLVATPIVCNVNTLGSFTATINSGGVAPFTYRLYDTSFNQLATSGTTAVTSFNFPGLTFGDYYITIVDANGCEYNSGVQRIQTPPILTLNGFVDSNSCATGVDYTVTTTGGIAPYTFSIFGQPGTVSPPQASPTYTFLGLLHNTTYFLQVQDVNNCISILEILTPNAPSTIEITGTTSTDVTCNGTSNGTLAFTVQNYDATVTDINYQILDALSLLPITPAINGTLSGAAGGPVSTSITTLPAGSYVLQATEASGTLCSANYTFQITQPLQPVNATVTGNINANCNSGAQVTVTTTGGTGPYQYAAGAPGFTPVPTDFGSNNVLNLDFATRANWDIVVRDANDCEVRLNETIARDADPTINPVAQQCFTGTPFNITITGTTSTAIETYSIGGAYQASPNFTISASGTYTLSIQDGNGCIASTSYVVEPQLLLDANMTQDLTCTVDASITLTPTGGVGPYTYEVSFNSGAYSVIAGTPYTTSVDGTYQFRVTDSQTCQAESGIITVTPAINPTLTEVHTDVSCIGGADGSITVTAIGGLPPYRYSIDNGGTFQASNVFTGLNVAGGPYNVVVRDAKNCDSAATIVAITEPTDVTGTPALTQGLTCGAGNATQSAIVTITPDPGAGTPPYTYSFDGGINYTSNNTFTTNTAGIVSALIRDSNGCTSLPITINVPALDPPTDLDFVSTPVTCLALTSDVTLTATDGVGPLAYAILSPASATGNVTGAASGIFTGLAPDTYLFEVTDANGCTYEESYTVDPVINITVSGVLVSDVSCNGGSNGAVDFTVGDFAGTYSYTINGGAAVTGQSAATINLTGLPAGNQLIVVTDETTGCTDTFTVPVGEPTLLTLAETININANCGFGAQVTVAASNGTPAYTYAFVQDGVAPVPADYTNSASTVLDPATNTNWDVWVQDANGCTAQIDVVIATDALPTIDPVALQCFTGTPFSITLSGTTYNGAANYSIGGGYQASPTFTINAAGTYTVSIQDDNGCTATTTYTVEPQLLLTANLTKDLDCTVTPDGSIALTASGGTGTYTTYEVNYNSGGFAVIAGTPYTATADGTYEFRVTDSQGCMALSNIITVNPLVTPTLTEVHTDVSCIGGADGSIVVTASNGVPPYRYSIDNGGTFQASNVFTGLNVAGGPYNVVVRDAKNCDSAATIVAITEPTDVTGTPALTQGLTCGAGNATQSAIVTITPDPGAGTPPYTYSFDGGINYTSNNTFTTNTAGIVSALIRDSNGCTSLPITINVPALDPPTDLDFVSTPVTCLALTSDVTLTATDGVGPLAYAILSPASATGNVTGAASGIFTGLAPDTYLFEVTDANGCTYEESYTVDPVINITVSGVLVSDVSCNGGSNGAVDFTVGDFAGTYSYTINGGAAVTGQSAATINLTGLPAGNQLIVVTDETTGCTDTFTVPVGEPTLLTLAETININANCGFGAQVTVAASNGTPAYTYAFVQDGVAPVPADYTNSASTVLDPATNTNWDVWVQDANGCTAQIDVVIATDPLPTITVPAMTTCVAGADPFTFTATGSSGVGPLEYSIGTGFQSSGTFTVSAAGTYTVTVRDANGCTAISTPITVYEPLDLTPAITALPSCSDDDGVITVTPSGGSGTYTYTISPNPVSISFAGNVFSGVPSGTYTIEITDTVTTCTNDVSVTLSAATPVTFTTDVVNVSCNGGNDGSITVNLPASNDNPVYTYEITAPIVVAPQTSNIFTGLVAGNYTVRVTSGRGCFDTAVVPVTEPALLTVSGLATPYTCAPDNTVNASILTINEVGGTAPYTYSIDGTNYFTANTFDIIDTGSAQTINIFVRDDNGCVATNTIAIAPLPALTAATVAIVTPIDCNGTGSVAITVTGGSGNFSYQLLPSGTPQASNIFNITDPGNYFFQVNDLTTGCTIPAQFSVAPFDTIDAVITATTAVTCFTDTNGAFEINVTGYTGPYNYDILDSTGASVRGLTAANTSTNPEVVMGLTGGNYTVVVTETASPFCTTTSNVVTIDSPATPLVVVATETFNVTCDNDKGVISAVASGGRLPYEYELTGAATVAYSSNGTFRDLAAGSYTVNVRDAGGCIASDPITLTIPTPIDATVTPSTNLLACFGDTNATITVSLVTGGQGSNYTYTLNMVSPTATSSGPQTSPIFTDLGAGTYNVTVTDGYNCVFNSPNVVINEPTQIETTLAVATTQTCLTSSELTLSATGGTGPYTYSDTVNFVTTLGSFTSSVTFPVGAGTHVYYVRDANGCSSNVSNEIRIDPLPTLVVNLDSVNPTINCAGDNTGTITATAQGGLGNYVYTLQDGSGTNITPVTQDSPGVFTNLVAGTYQVRVDSGDCLETSALITITEPSAPLEAIFVPSAVTCPGSNDGTLQINATGGTGVIRYAISPRLDQFFETSTFEDLAPGTYQAIAQDELGCFVFESFTIGAPTPVIVTVVPNSLIPEICEGDMDGEFSIDITGGNLPYSVALDDINGVYTTGTATQTQFDFPGLAGGDHIVFVRDALGCESEWNIDFPESVRINPEVNIDYGCTGNLSTNTVTVTVDDSITDPTDIDYSLDGGPYQASNVFVNVPPGLDHYIDARHTNGCIQRTETFDISQFDPLMLVLEDGELNEIVAVTSGGAAPFEYTLNDESYGSENRFLIYASGDYTVTVTDSNGCIATATRYFEYVDVCISNYFTPNGDGDLDEWGPGCTSQYKDLTFDIFDRYGRAIATLRVGDTWDGKYNGAELPTGDYWYVLKLNDPKDDREFVGHFTLYR